MVPFKALTETDELENVPSEATHLVFSPPSSPVKEAVDLIAAAVEVAMEDVVMAPALAEPVQVVPKAAAKSAAAAGLMEVDVLQAEEPETKPALAAEFSDVVKTLIDANSPTEADLIAASVVMTNRSRSHTVEPAEPAPATDKPAAEPEPEPEPDLVPLPIDLAAHAILEPCLLTAFDARDELRGHKMVELRTQYKALQGDWDAHCKRLDKIKERVQRKAQLSTLPGTPAIDDRGLPFYHGPDPAAPGAGLGLGQPLTGPTGRANRRSNANAGLSGYGDAARSEAEFLEILASLETADMRDPTVRASRTAAVVPDLILDANERRQFVGLEQDDRRRVDDPVEFYGVHAPPDEWTADESAAFEKRFALHPKQFGRIAEGIEHKTTAQCVLHYYRTKTVVDYRGLLDRKNRDPRKRKPKKRTDADGIAKKSSSLLSNLKKAKKPAADEAEDDYEGGAHSPQLAKRPLPGSGAGDPGSGLFKPRASGSRGNGNGNGNGTGDSASEHDDRPRPARKSRTHAATGSGPSAAAKAAVAAAAAAQAHPEAHSPTVALPAPAALAPPQAPQFESAPMSDGLMEAAEVLGALFGATAPDAGEATDDEPEYEDPRDSSYGAAPARARKPAAVHHPAAVAAAARLVAKPVLVPQPVLPAVGEANELSALAAAAAGQAAAAASASASASAAARRKSTGSSYWSVAERTEFMTLLGRHGKDWNMIAQGLENKTPVQCKNWYTNHQKKLAVNDALAAGHAHARPPEGDSYGALHRPMPEHVQLQGPGGQAGLPGLPGLPRAGFFVSDAPRVAEVVDGRALLATSSLQGEQGGQPHDDRFFAETRPASRVGNIRSLLNEDTPTEERPDPVDAGDWFGAADDAGGKEDGSVTTEDEGELKAREAEAFAGLAAQAQAQAQAHRRPSFGGMMERSYSASQPQQHPAYAVLDQHRPATVVGYHSAVTQGRLPAHLATGSPQVPDRGLFHAGPSAPSSAQALPSLSQRYDSPAGQARLPQMSSQWGPSPGAYRSPGMAAAPSPYAPPSAYGGGIGGGGGELPAHKVSGEYSRPGGEYVRAEEYGAPPAGEYYARPGSQPQVGGYGRADGRDSREAERQAGRDYFDPARGGYARPGTGGPAGSGLNGSGYGAGAGQGGWR